MFPIKIAIFGDMLHFQTQPNGLEGSTKRLCGSSRSALEGSTVVVLGPKEFDRRLEERKAQYDYDS